LSKQASKTVIGSFVVSALVLVVVGVLIFGSGNYLKERYRFMLFFKDSVKGLSMGAPVIFEQYFGISSGSHRSSL